MESIIPVIDTDKLQNAANEAALKGAISVINDFYTGYDSDYKKSLRAELNNKRVDHAFDLPDIVSVLNAKISQQIDEISNTAVAKTFLPLAREILTRAEPTIKFSNILKKYIELFYDKEEHEYYDFSVERTREKDSFLTFEISSPGKTYDINIYASKLNDEFVYEIYTLPFKSPVGHGYGVKETMKISLDGGGSLEMPFVKGVLDDPFVSFIARYVINNTSIVFDCESFDADFFPEDECYCH